MASVDSQSHEPHESHKTHKPDGSLARHGYRRDLGDGLVLRWSTPEDVERVAALYAQVFRRTVEAAPGLSAPLWARDMFSGRHPHIGPRDFALVEDTRSGAIVACACLLGYTCRYEGIPFGFGRPEAVATLPDYRRRGLIRSIFELLHARSTERGHLVQGITGIPNFYRQFGYEYALLLDEGFTVYFPAIPALKSGAAEPYSLREATLDDIPLLCGLWERVHASAAVWNDIEADYWRWAMAGMDPEARERWRVYLIVDSAGRKVGALIHLPWRWGTEMRVSALSVEAGVPLVRAVPSVLRGLRALADTSRPMRPEVPEVTAINFQCSDPALRGAMGDTPFVELAYKYAWYVRVADLPRFLRHIAPVLERRLEQSAHAGYTGELTLDFYRGGLRLAFESGKLITVEDWRRPVWGQGMAGFPPLVFLQALFGYRSLDDLRRVYPDVWAEGEATALLDALFPKRPSLLMPLD